MGDAPYSDTITQSIPDTKLLLSRQVTVILIGDGGMYFFQRPPLSLGNKFPDEQNTDRTNARVYKECP